MSAPAAATAPAPSRLRVSHIWQQEVMGDTVVPHGQPITLGREPGCTFTTPALGLPPRFQILRPGARGYVLTLGTGMTGTVCIDGSEQLVTQFVRHGGRGAEGTEGGFRATPVGPGDWGVIHLDDSEDHTFFFQFVEEEPPLPPPVWVLGPLLAPALAFAIIFHAILVTATYLLKDDGHSFLYPGGRELLTGYFVDRPEEELPPEPEPPKEKVSGAEEAAPEKTQRATKGDQGKAGGKGEKRQTTPNPRKGEPDAPRVALNTDRSREAMNRVRNLGNIDGDLRSAMDGLKRKTASLGDPGKGKGSGSGFGDDHGGTGNTVGAKPGGRGGGGDSEGELQNQKGIKVGKNRPGKGKGGSGLKEASVGIGNGSGDFTRGLSKADVEKVMRKNKGKFRACYQAAVNRTPGLSGTVTMRFTIDARGNVKRAAVVRGKSNMNNSTVENCIKRKVERLTFPAKGGAQVTGYPLVFSQG